MQPNSPEAVMRWSFIFTWLSFISSCLQISHRWTAGCRDSWLRGKSKGFLMTLSHSCVLSDHKQLKHIWMSLCGRPHVAAWSLFGFSYFSILRHLLSLLNTFVLSLPPPWSPAFGFYSCEPGRMCRRWLEVIPSSRQSVWKIEANLDGNHCCENVSAYGSDVMTNTYCDQV